MSNSDNAATMELVGRSGLDVDTVQRALEGDLNSLNELGYVLVHEGYLEEGLTFLSESAQGGFPWALSTYSWYRLLAGEYQQARDLFDECEQACIELVEDYEIQGDFGFQAGYQWVNAQSNDALCRLALGDSYEYALSVWEEGAEFGHAESEFFPALVAWKQGRKEDAAEIIANLSRSTLKEIRATLRECVNDANGWFADWCREGMTVLRESTPKGAKTPAERGIVGDFSKVMSGNSQPSHNYCTSCGNQLISGNKFCIGCGAKV